MAHATSIPQSRPRRAAAAASTIQQGGWAHRNHRATGTSSMASEKSTAGVGDSYLLYGPGGCTIWEPRRFPKILQDLWKPIPKPLPEPLSAEPGAAASEYLLGFLTPLPTAEHSPTEAVTAAGNKAVGAKTNNKKQSGGILIAEKVTAMKKPPEQTAANECTIIQESTKTAEPSAQPQSTTATAEMTVLLNRQYLFIWLLQLE